MGARRQRVVVAALTVALVLGTGIALADRTVVVGTSTESWYHVTPAGGVGSGPELNPYPPGTLHVGVAGGQEESRSYLALDLGALPADAEISGGTLVLPIADDAGTRSPESASIRLCRAQRPGEPVEGSTDAPPPADCSLSTDATHAPGRNAFVADLDPLVGFLDGGLAIVPAVGDDGSWHVAFNGGAGSDASKIAAELRIDDDDGAAAGVGASAAPPPDSSAFAAAVHPEATGPAPVQGLGSMPSSPTDVPLASPTGPGADAPVPTGQGRLVTPFGTPAESGFRYSIIFGLPLVLLVGIPYFGYSLTAPIPVGGRGGR